MKKLSGLALILASCVILSACEGGTSGGSADDISNMVHQPNIDEIMSSMYEMASGEESDNNSYEPDSTASLDLNSDGSVYVKKSDKPEIPDIEAISPKKLEYEFIKNGDYGSGIRINGISTAAEDIRFPDTIDGEPVVYINLESKDYSSNVKTLIFPDSVATCGRIPKSVEFVKLPENLAEDRVPTFEGCKNLEEVWLPDSITRFKGGSMTGLNAQFSGCSSLRSICLPSGLTEIGGSTFSGCSNLESIYIPRSVKSIGGWAFADCTSLTSVNLSRNATVDFTGLFSGCSSLTSVTIPKNATSIGREAFKDCSSLTEITIPDSVTIIGDEAFKGCTSLTSITLPDNLTDDPSVGENMFTTGCLGKAAFNGCLNLTSITVPDGVTIIEGNTFHGCSGLTSITLPDSVTMIRDNAFEDCSNLTEITIPDSVTSIGSAAFKGCSGLTNIKIPDSVTYISSEAFANCSSLTDVNIPDSVTIEGRVFSGCYKLFDDRGLIIRNNRLWLSDRNNIVDSNITSFEIPSGVTSIESGAFRECDCLISVTIPDGVTRIGNSAFAECYDLTNIAIPDSVTSIGDDAFFYCSSLIIITIPDNIAYIGFSAFNDCDNLKTIYYKGKAYTATEEDTALNILLKENPQIDS